MANGQTPRTRKPITFCPLCKRRGVLTCRLPSGGTLCLPCIRETQATVYQNLVAWVTDHPPIAQEPTATPP